MTKNYENESRNYSSKAGISNKNSSKNAMRSEMDRADSKTASKNTKNAGTMNRMSGTDKAEDAYRSEKNCGRY